MRVFWFEFDEVPAGLGLSYGCGITARDEADAHAMLRKHVLHNAHFKVRRVIVDVAYNDLDASHVRPNMGIMLRRGIWFPLGYYVD